MARRSHAERTAETRGRVIRAVVESIGEVGYQRTTSARIAERAGVTWGAVQHHFGDKDGILMAVLQESFDRFAKRLADVPDAGAPLETRVSLFVDRSWEHFASAHYRSTFEILLNLPPDLPTSWQGGMLEAWSEIWSRYFPAARRSRRRTLDLMHYTISVLSGLAATRMLEGEAAAARGSELGFLKETLVRELGRGAA
ncbi:MAG: TetR/AcrR family transcriptional regulator [Myxococcota bacterium]